MFMDFCYRARLSIKRNLYGNSLHRTRSFAFLHFTFIYAVLLRNYAAWLQHKSITEKLLATSFAGAIFKICDFCKVAAIFLGGSNNVELNGGNPIRLIYRLGFRRVRSWCRCCFLLMQIVCMNSWLAANWANTHFCWWIVLN